ncbi:hypothetical protein SAMN06265173_108105 [Thalassovita litoralis]|jgi:hypothetical protein|uniref:Uncharacterized protein n=1 Tax=Thalassovita litoralis TaxID=1010611 RepID=A0A521D112_9RHOB|nr:hypothetical protein [Thalassovita litoralis]SMO65364.1 hypothetical protein SAMN06265173_108105 [Thalassovita litoralis]
MIIPGHPTPFVAGSKVLPPEPLPFTTAWRLPSTFEDISSHWVNEPNAFVEDASYSHVSSTAAYSTGNCYFDGYGFSSVDVPENATILGVELQMQFMSTSSNVTEVLAWLFTATDFATEYQYNVSSGQIYTITFGGPSDLWGLAPLPTPADIYGDNLRVILQFRDQDPSVTSLSGRLYYAKIRIHGEGVFA